ncbi:hypothetical protein [Pseudoduganella violacea]|uniref:Uncharacterized protein n=1 Tax=Pseudoduganella violacea TaxID=1715466 RepID=A0A7W5BDZ5_9BURK|nr:hypothetical protein [Pseudoduganella violacea]MBB3121467.1 hypothetical protein [Pseudoduganella violacea]
MKTYHEIPYAYLGRPPASLWEVRAAVREQVARGKKHIDENSIFQGIAEMREIEAKAAISTKSARRNEERRRTAEKTKPQAKREQAVSREENSGHKRPTVPAVVTPDEDEIIEAFDDIDVR